MADKVDFDTEAAKWPLTDYFYSVALDAKINQETARKADNLEKFAVASAEYRAYSNILLMLLGYCTPIHTDISAVYELDKQMNVAAIRHLGLTANQRSVE